MAYCYQNRRGESHYIKVVPTKKGKLRYYIVRDVSKYTEDELIDIIPQGFEIYESPEEGRVVLRKRIHSKITEFELEIIEEAIEAETEIGDYILDKEQDAIMVYVASLTLADTLTDDEAFLRKIQRYFAELRFEKLSEEKYCVQRFCSLSRYYGWITIETHSNLSYLGEKYCPHIKKESLLQFWIEGEEDW